MHRKGLLSELVFEVKDGLSERLSLFRNKSKTNHMKKCILLRQPFVHTTGCCLQISRKEKKNAYIEITYLPVVKIINYPLKYNHVFICHRIYTYLQVLYAQDEVEIVALLFQ